MQIRGLMVGALVFLIALIGGVFVVDYFAPNVFKGETTFVSTREVPPPPPAPAPPPGSGISGSDTGKTVEETPAEPPCAGTCAIKILSKPRANYTEEARENSTEGNVKLRVTFLASGEIGTVSPVERLPDGLTEAAVEAAKKIKFRPATREGVPYTTVKTVQYGFTIY